MKDKRREILLGYLLEALEPHESAKVDAELETNEQLQNDLAEIYREISPINEIVDYHEPPADLAGRTCRNLWEKIDSDNAEKSTKNNILPLTPHASPKKHRATVVFTQFQPELPKNDSIINADVQACPDELRLDAPIPLSQAVRMAGDKPVSAAKLIRRIDTAEQMPAAQSKLNKIFVEDAKPTKGQLPKYYGRKTKTETQTKRRPWMVRDVFASLLVGLTAAVLIFPLIQMGMGNFREMIIQKKLQSVAQSMSPTTSQFSLTGLSQGDLRALVSMNIDPHSASQLQAQRGDTTTFSFSSSPKNTVATTQSPMQTPLQMPMIVPAGFSFPVSEESFRTISPDPLRIVPDFLSVIDNHVAVSPYAIERDTAPLRSDKKANPLTSELPKQDVVDMLLIKELAHRSHLPLTNVENATWHSPGCNFIEQTP